jgi:acyl-CoA synthetase (AMP-forming)/AMP-acid ligase II
MALANYVNIRSAIDLSSADATPNFLPLFHTAGINLHSLPTLMAGGRVVVLEDADAGRLVRLFEERRLDTFFAVHPSTRRCSISRASRPRLSIMSVIGAAAARLCPIYLSSATERWASVSATEWA